MLPSLRLAAAAALACLFLAPYARAQDASDEVVTLKSGAVYRGQLVEKVPGDHVTLKLATGEVKRLPWLEVQRSASAQGAEPPPRPRGVDGPRLVLDADDPQTSLFAMSETGNVQGVVAGRGYTGGFESWRSACVAPCGTTVDPRLTYRVAGIGITPSTPFVLPQGREEVRLRVQTGSALWHGVGGSLTWTGLSLAILGGLVTALSFAFDEPQPGRTDLRGAFRTGGLVGLGVGGGMMLVGLPLLLTTNTSVQSSSGESLAATPGGGLRF